MVSRIEFDATAKKQLNKLDNEAAIRIAKFLRERVSSLDNPRMIGESLPGHDLESFGNTELAIIAFYAD